MTESKPLAQALANALQEQDLPAAAIPQLDLYMEQVISLFEGLTAAGCQAASGEKKKKGKEGPLTKTMINNYSKEGLLLAGKGKKYSPAHIMQMQLISNLKPVLPLAEIKQLLDYAKPVLTSGEGKDYDRERVAALNQCFLQGKTGLRQQLPEAVAQFRRGFAPLEQPLPEKLEQVLDVLCLSALAAYAQKAAGSLIAQLAEKQQDSGETLLK